MKNLRLWIDPKFMLHPGIATSEAGGVATTSAVIGLGMMSLLRGRSDGRVPARDAQPDAVARLLRAEEDAFGDHDGWTEKDGVRRGIQSGFEHGLLTEEEGFVRIVDWGTLVGASSPDEPGVRRRDLMNGFTAISKLVEGFESEGWGVHMTAPEGGYVDLDHGQLDEMLRDLDRLRDVLRHALTCEESSETEPDVRPTTSH